jgi:hypothetical protein
MRLLHLLALAASLCLPGILLAQDFPPGGGRQVRVVSPAFDGVGFVREVRADTLSLLVENVAAPILVPIPSITRLDVRRRNTTGEGVLKGTLWGAGIGLSLGLVTAGFSDRAEGETATGIIVSTALVSTAIGAFWGAIRPGSRWVRVALP